jgi:hypothetical protein
VLSVAPQWIKHFEIHGQAGFILHMPANITVNLVDTAGAPKGSTTTADLYVQAGNLKNATGTTTLFAANSDYMRALWNYYLLHGDASKGIHNPKFFTAVIGATSMKVAALP